MLIKSLSHQYRFVVASEGPQGSSLFSQPREIVCSEFLADRMLNLAFSPSLKYGANTAVAPMRSDLGWHPFALGTESAFGYYR